MVEVVVRATGPDGEQGDADVAELGAQIVRILASVRATDPNRWVVTNTSADDPLPSVPAMFDARDS